MLWQNRNSHSTEAHTRPDQLPGSSLHGLSARSAWFPRTRWGSVELKYQDQYIFGVKEPSLLCWDYRRKWELLFHPFFFCQNILSFSNLQCSTLSSYSSSFSHFWLARFVKTTIKTLIKASFFYGSQKDYEHLTFDYLPEHKRVSRALFQDDSLSYPMNQV